MYFCLGVNKVLLVLVPSCGSGRPYGNFDNRPGASFKLNHDHVVAMKQCSPVDRPSTNMKISFAGRSAVAGKSENKTQRRIDTFTFFIPSAITVKEETGGWLTATPEQTPTTRKQEETNTDPQLNHKLPTEHDEPNSQPRLAHFGLEVSAHQVSGMEIIITAHRLSTLELKTTLPFPRGWSRKPTSAHPGTCKTRR